MNSLIFIMIVAVHWICDFVLQTDEQAKNKSSNIFYLLEHTAFYSVAWTVILLLISATCIAGGIVFMSIPKILLFGLITFVCHTVTSRLNSKLWAKGDVHNFFVSIGFNQVLHYVQLVLTLKYLL